MKKITIGIFMTIMVAVLAACGGEEAKGKVDEENQKEVEVAVEEEKEEGSTEEKEIKEIQKDFVFNNRGESKEVSFEEVQVHDGLKAQVFLPQGFELAIDKNGSIVADGTGEFTGVEVDVVVSDRFFDEPHKEFENFRIGLEGRLTGSEDEITEEEINLNGHSLDGQYGYVITLEADFDGEMEEYEQKVYGGIQSVDDKVYIVEVWIYDRELFENDDFVYGIMKNIIPKQ
ncbi:hypothetical protein ACQ4XT_08460 [Halobacillus faecis]